jgi:hypothetical protein
MRVSYFDLVIFRKIDRKSRVVNKESGKKGFAENAAKKLSKICKVQPGGRGQDEMAGQGIEIN